ALRLRDGEGLARGAAGPGVAREGVRRVVRGRREGAERDLTVGGARVVLAAPALDHGGHGAVHGAAVVLHPLVARVLAARVRDEAVGREVEEDGRLVTGGAGREGMRAARVGADGADLLAQAAGLV